MTEEALSPAQRARIRRLSNPDQPHASEEGGELNVVPYLDIIMNIMMFVLASVSVAFVTTINTSAASADTRGIRKEVTGLQLTALITGQGVALKTAGASIAPGCESVGPGLTIPNRGAEVDVAGLAACARKIKARPEAASETQVTLAASPGVPYATVVAVMDALRADAEGGLFPEVTLGAVR